MKKFMLASGAALLMTSVYVWGSKPSAHFGSTSQQNVCTNYMNDTLPKKRDTLPSRDTMRRKDSIQ